MWLPHLVRHPLTCLLVPPGGWRRSGSPGIKPRGGGGHQPTGHSDQRADLCPQAGNQQAGGRLQRTQRGLAPL